MSNIMPAEQSQQIPMTKPYITVAEAILEQLQLWGVKRIYGVVGDSIFDFMDAVARQEALSFIAVKHESAAAMMASAEAKATGGLGVCMGHMGPGLANLLNGLGDAFLDQAPVLAITGQAPIKQIGTAYKQLINQQQMVRSVSSISQLVVHPDAVIESLAEAIQTSVRYRTVSHLSIPGDLFRMSTAHKPHQKPHIEIAAAPAALRQALQILQSAKRPMILAGGTVRDASAAIQALAEAWGCGIAMGYGAAGIIPDSHPNMLSGLGEGGNPHLPELFKQADVVLAIETSWWPKESVPIDTRVVHVSSHPSEYKGSMPVEIGIIGDPAAILSGWLKELQPFTPDPEWLGRVRQCKQAWSVQNEKEGSQSSSPLAPSRMVRILEQQAAEDAVIALDEGDSTVWFLRNFRGNHQRVLLSERWRSMGFGLPAALAAKLCFPDKQVICITGDGGLEMVLADLLTAVRYGLAITVLVFNNGTLQMERDKMLMKGLQPEGTVLTNPSFVKLAEACGWDSYPVETAEQLEAALARSFSGNQPALLDIRTANLPHPDFINSPQP